MHTCGLGCGSTVENLSPWSWLWAFSYASQQNKIRKEEAFHSSEFSSFTWATANSLYNFKWKTGAWNLGGILSQGQIWDELLWRRFSTGRISSITKTKCQSWLSSTVFSNRSGRSWLQCVGIWDWWDWAERCVAVLYPWASLKCRIDGIHCSVSSSHYRVWRWEWWARARLDLLGLTFSHSVDCLLLKSSAEFPLSADLTSSPLGSVLEDWCLSWLDQMWNSKCQRLRVVVGHSLAEYPLVLLPFLVVSQRSD